MSYHHPVVVQHVITCSFEKHPEPLLFFKNMIKFRWKKYFVTYPFCRLNVFYCKSIMIELALLFI